jgi:uroporphyrinogen decarboxylase
VKKTGKPVLDALSGRKPERVPLWLMRQAGRYLPEYRALRAQADNFLDLCLHPAWAAEITMQPLRRFHMDAAILFADILLVPYAMGQELAFKEAVGPILNPIAHEGDFAKLGWDVAKLGPVFETLERVKTELPDDAALLGFAGGLWTVACYMIEGQGKDGFSKAVAMAKNDRNFLNLLLEKLESATIEYLGRQIEAGAEALYLFDSWAGLLDEALFNELVIAPTKRLVTALKLEYPEIPVIGFPRGAGPENCRRFLLDTGVDALAIDSSIPLFFAREELQKIKPLQGNLDPALVVAGGSAMIRGATEVLDQLAAGPVPHIFSLGHGILPETPPENVAALVSFVRSWTAA